MPPFDRRRLLLAGVGLTAALAGCTDDGPPPAVVDPDAPGWQNLDDAGGLDALVAAAVKERRLTMIGFPTATYAALITSYEQTYGVQVDHREPDATAQRQLNVANENNGTERAADVFDLDLATAMANSAAFAPYQPATLGDIDADHVAPDRTWIAGYARFLSIGYDPRRIFAVSSLEDLTLPDAKDGVGIAGDPLTDDTGVAAVIMAALGAGAATGDLGPGIEFFARLEQVGNLVPTVATRDTIASGATSMVIDWDDRNLRAADALPGWLTMVPSEAQLGRFGYLAINAEAPHPAAARLWHEHVLSDTGQNLLAAALLHPVRARAMTEAGTADRPAFDRLPPLAGDTVEPTTDELAAGREQIRRRWPTEVGS